MTLPAAQRNAETPAGGGARSGRVAPPAGARKRRAMSLNEQIRKVIEDYEDDQGEFTVCHLTCLVGAIQAFVFDRETTQGNTDPTTKGTDHA